jgi:hypothetical protein
MLQFGRPVIAQSMFVKHWTHVLVAGLQRVAIPSPTQFMLLKHWTQRLVIVSQYGVGGMQVPLVVHVRTQR